MTISRILVLRPGAIGDTLLTLPALLAVRRRFPGAQVDVFGNPEPLRLGAAVGILDDAGAFGAAWLSDLFGDEPTPRLRARLEPYDLALVWLHSRDAAEDLARRLETAGVRQAWGLVSFPPAGSRRHLADHLVDTLAPMGVTGPRPVVTLLPTGSPLLRSVPSRRSEGERAPLIVCHPGAGGRHKRWPAARFAALADRFAELGNAVAITHGPADGDAVAAMRAALQKARPDVLDGLSLDDLARVLAEATLYVGNDSGITHLAAMLGVPTLALFGPHDPAYWAPIGQHVRVIDAGQSCPHRDDPREGCRRCVTLASLDVETVWEQARTLAGRAARVAADGMAT